MPFTPTHPHLPTLYVLIVRHILVIQARVVGERRQEDFEDSLGCIVSSKSVCIVLRSRGDQAMWVTVVYEDGKVSGGRGGVELGESANRETGMEKSADSRLRAPESLGRSKEELIHTAGGP